MKYRSGYKHKLIDNILIELEPNPLFANLDIDSKLFCLKGNKLWVHYGYCWDGATLFPDFKWILMPSLTHDLMIQINREFLNENKLFRIYADKELKRLCIKNGSGILGANIVYLGVRYLSRLLIPFKKRKHRIREAPSV